VRSSPLKDTPTLRELWIDVTAREWAGLFAPAGTPPEIVNRVAQASAAALAKPAVQSEFAKYVMDVGGTVTTEFATMVKADYDRWGRVVKRSGVKAES
jgi:tripartite-type tricarboxylate transporter receptor subunit TctC